MAIAIVTDSTADLPAEMAARLSVHVVSLNVIFGDQTLREGIEIGQEEFYRRLQTSSTLPTTAAPAIGDFLRAYEAALAGGCDGILSLHLSSKLSATYSNAVQAATMLESSISIEVVDSLTGSLGLGILVIRAAEAAQAGATLPALAALVADMIPRLRVAFVLDTLENLRRGGRIGRANAFLGHLLSIKPILSIRDGEVHPEERVRSRSAALDRLFQMMAAESNPEAVAVAHNTVPGEAAAMRDRLAAVYPGVPLYETRIGPVLGVHTGSGTIGVGVLRRKGAA
ncbi:MAG TPA: DegV family protein [Dehalococcoidia bacterium]|nr:DegV family protein [Dehalococcoidia bacterium]